MKLLHRAATVVAAAAIAFTGLATQSASAAEVDIYTTPGGHVKNGRLWETTCEKYSSDVVRCQTDIYAKTVVRKGSRYVTDERWHFNNLTYLPSDRARWANNPLGKTGEFTSDGRQWRTECDTAATGRGGCRSYAKVHYVAQENGRYVTKHDFVFNNLVRFSSSTIPAVKEIPAHVFDQSRLDFNGLGPLQLGTKLSDLHKLGYAWVDDGEHCTVNRPADTLEPFGIQTNPGLPTGSLFYVKLVTPRIATADGAKVGMTIEQIKAIYGSRFQIVTKTNQTAVEYFGSVRSGDRELLFRVADGDHYAPDRPLVDSDVVAEIRAWDFATDVSEDGC